MKKILLLSFLSLLTAASTFAQHHYQSVLDTLYLRSGSLALLQQQMESQRSVVAAETLLDDPSISFEHLWSSHTGEGNRWNMSISQELPVGQYSVRRRIREFVCDTIEARWLVQRQHWMLDMQHLCAEIVYTNMQLAHYTHCVEMAEQVADAVSRRMDLGDCNVIEYNRAQLELVALQNKQQLLLTLRESRMMLLRTYNNNIPITVADTIFPDIMLADSFDDWYEQIRRRAPELQMMAKQTQLQHEQFRLSQREALPRVTAGVVAEYEADCLFRGLAVGVNVPIWNRRRQVSGARLVWHTAQQEEQLIEQQLSGRLRMLYTQVQALLTEVDRLSAQCALYDSEALLLKSFLMGELPLESYLRQVEFFHDTELAVIAARYALERAWLDLMAVTL